MKILQINSAKAFGGGERHLIDLCSGLQSRGHEVFVALRANNQWQEKLNFLPKDHLVHFPLRNSADIFSAQKIARFVQEKRIKIIHAHVARDYPIAAMASRLSKTPLVLTRHLTYPLSGLHRLTGRQANKIIAVSKGVAESLLDRNFINKNKISVVYNGVDIANFEKIERKELNDNLTVATIGELREHKGQEAFIKAASIISKNHPTAKFLLIGKDNSTNRSYQTYLENLVEKLDLKDQVIFKGWLDNPREIYESFDIFVSSAQSEPFGLVIAEAMATGKGIVATKTVGAKELLTDNESGKLISVGNVGQLADAVSELLKDEKLRRVLGENARKRVKEFFSLEKMVSETERIYQEVVERE